MGRGICKAGWRGRGSPLPRKGLRMGVRFGERGASEKGVSLWKKGTTVEQGDSGWGRQAYLVGGRCFEFCLTFVLHPTPDRVRMVLWGSHNPLDPA